MAVIRLVQTRWCSLFSAEYVRRVYKGMSIKKKLQVNFIITQLFKNFFFTCFVLIIYQELDWTAQLNGRLVSHRAEIKVSPQEISDYWLKHVKSLRAFGVNYSLQSDSTRIIS